ncbi:MAG: hypothetical protein RL685_6227 [Pseudomonadota bacterium]|jgi:hypothetical protein
MLEVVRHVNIGHDLVRPTTECLSGSRLITSYFKSNPDHEPLGRRALELIKRQAGDGLSYSVVGTEWVSASIPPGRLESYGGALDSAPDVEGQIANLRQRVKTMIRHQERLLHRLARLETRTRAGGDLDHPEALGEHIPAELGEHGAAAEVSPVAAGEAAAAEAAEARWAEPERAADQVAPASAASAAPRLSQAAPGAHIALDARARPLTALELPPVAELCKCIALLVGNGSTLEEGEPLLAAELGQSFAVGIETEAGEQVGLVVMDLRATVFLGGSLMMQPIEQLEQQFRSATPEPDSIAASAEICNALCAAVNAAQSRYHVRATPLAPLELARHDWLVDVVTRRDLRDSFGGRTALLARPGA